MCFPQKKKFFNSTPLKINMEHNHGGLVQISFLSKWVICRFQPLIFQGVRVYLSSTNLGDGLLLMVDLTSGVYLPGTPRRPLFLQVKYPQNKAEIPIKTRGPIWVLGTYIPGTPNNH